MTVRGVQMTVRGVELGVCVIKMTRDLEGLGRLGKTLALLVLEPTRGAFEIGQSVDPRSARS